MDDLQLTQHEQIWELYDVLLTCFQDDYFTAKELAKTTDFHKKQVNKILHHLAQKNLLQVQKDAFGCNHYKLINQS